MQFPCGAGRPNCEARDWRLPRVNRFRTSISSALLLQNPPTSVNSPSCIREGVLLIAFFCTQRPVRDVLEHIPSPMVSMTTSSLPQLPPLDDRGLFSRRLSFYTLPCQQLTSCNTERRNQNVGPKLDLPKRVLHRKHLQFHPVWYVVRLISFSRVGAP